MNLAICGGRDFKATERAAAWVCQELARRWPTLVLHGGCRGADTFGASCALLGGLEVESIKADWGKHGKAAGPIRNREIARRLGANGVLLAFPGGPETEHLIAEAEKVGATVVRYGVAPEVQGETA